MIFFYAIVSLESRPKNRFIRWRTKKIKYNKLRFDKNSRGVPVCSPTCIFSSRSVQQYEKWKYWVKQWRFLSWCRNRKRVAHIHNEPIIHTLRSVRNSKINILPWSYGSCVTIIYLVQLIGRIRRRNNNSFYTTCCNSCVPRCTWLSIIVITSSPMVIYMRVFYTRLGFRFVRK